MIVPCEARKALILGIVTPLLPLQVGRENRRSYTLNEKQRALNPHDMNNGFACGKSPVLSSLMGRFNVTSILYLIKLLIVSSGWLEYVCTPDKWSVMTQG